MLGGGGGVHAQPCVILSEGLLHQSEGPWRAPSPRDLWEGSATQRKGGLVRDGGLPAVPPEPVHCREGRWRPGPSTTLDVPEVPDIGFKGRPLLLISSPNSSAALLLPLLSGNAATMLVVLTISP